MKFDDKTQRIIDNILHASPKATRSSFAGHHFAQIYHQSRPGLFPVQVADVANTFRINIRKFDFNAYRLAFILAYLELEGVNTLTPELGFTQEKQKMAMGFGSYNSIELIGNLGKDPELNVIADGTPVTRFSVAVNEYKGKDQQSGEAINETQWFNVVAWRQLAEHTEKFLSKGERVFVRGKLSQRKYTDREGVTRTSVEVIADTVVQLTKTQSGGDEEYSDDDFIPSEDQPLAPTPPAKQAKPQQSSRSKTPQQDRYAPR